MAVQDDQPVQLRGALFGINREDVSDLQALLERTKHLLADRVQLAGRELARADQLTDRLADAQSALATTQSALAQTQKSMEHAKRNALDQRDRADMLEERMESTMHDATVVAEHLDEAMVSLAGLIVESDDRDGDLLGSALRDLLPLRVESVSVTTAPELPDGVQELLRARESHTLTFSAVATNGAHDPAPDPLPANTPITESFALAGDSAVVVRYTEGVRDDGGGFSEMVERLAHAVACSLHARRMARIQAPQYQPVSLLGDDQCALRFATGRELRGQALDRVDVDLDPSVEDSLTGVWGAPAWNATYFDLAQRLDRAALSLGGAAFELQSYSFLCSVSSGNAEAMRTVAVTMLEDLGVSGSVSIL